MERNNKKKYAVVNIKRKFIDGGHKTVIDIKPKDKDIFIPPIFWHVNPIIMKKIIQKIKPHKTTNKLYGKRRRY